MQNRKVNKLRILEALGIVLIISAGVGFGVGFGLKPTSPKNNSDTSIDLDFNVQSVNSSLDQVLALNIADYSTVSFAKLAYVQNNKPASINLINSAGSSTNFTLSTGKDNLLLNGFTQNGNLYLPIKSGDIENSAYMELSKTESDDGMTSYLYVASIGAFKNDNNFYTSFVANNLSNTFDLNLTFNFTATPGKVLQPSGPKISEFDFATSDYGGYYGNVLSLNLAPSANVFNLLYLNTFTPTSISFEATTIGGSIEIMLLTGSTNPIEIVNQTFYLKINPVSVGRFILNYVVIEREDINGQTVFYFSGLVENTTEKPSFVEFSLLTNKPEAELDFVESN